MKTSMHHLAAVAIVSIAASSAQAGTVTLATTGTVAAGIDELGLFGNRGGLLDGQVFSLSISIDTDGLVPQASSWGAGGTINEAIQDPLRPTRVTGAVSVGGHGYTWAVADAQLAHITLAAAGAGSQDRPDIASIGGYGIAGSGTRVSASSELHTSSKGNEPFIGATDFDQQRSFDTQQNLLLSSSLFHASLGPGEGSNVGATTLLTYFTSADRLGSATWSYVSPVPEPNQAWMLLAGAGVVAWYRRRTSARRNANGHRPAGTRC